MRIGSVDLASDILIIAEIGNNHEGSVARAEELIGRAAEAGVGAVKFQTIVPERLVTSDQTARLTQLGRLCLDYDAFRHLAGVAVRAGVMFLSTPFDLESVSFLEPLVPAYKIASGDNTFFPLIAACARTGKPLIISTGLLDLGGVQRVQNVVEDTWRKGGIRQELAFLHCVVRYPAAPAEANLAAIRSLATLGATVGYSDHTLGIDAAVLAVVLGARIVEKHFTLDHHQSDFRDHQLSADPAQMTELVARVRDAVTLMGSGVKAPSPEEVMAGAAARRSIAAVRDLPAGAILGAADLTWLRPGGAFAPGDEGQVIGRILVRPVAAGAALRPEDLRDGSGAA